MNLNNFSFYKNKKILITGNTGFKGSWLTLWLKEIGATVFGYSLKINTSPSLFEILKLENKIDDIFYENICNLQLFKSFLLKKEPDIIFHFAAQPIVKTSYENPVSTFETNTIGTMNVLESVRYLKKKCIVIIITTDKVYENKEWIYPYRETDRLGGYDPYSSSKVCAEIITNSYYNSFFNIINYEQHGKKIAVARAGNVIGGGDWSDNRIIPDLVNSFLNNSSLELRSPDSIRPWQFVLESLCGYLTLGEFLFNNPPNTLFYSFNFGPNSSDLMSVGELSNYAINIFEKGKIKINKSDKFHETNFLSLDPTKANKILSWKSLLTTKEAISETVKWYKYYYENNIDIEEYTINQIRDYENKLQKSE